MHREGGGCQPHPPTVRGAAHHDDSDGVPGDGRNEGQRDPERPEVGARGACPDRDGERDDDRPRTILNRGLKVMAHEVGHYLGLFHTTEQNQRSTDPIADTPDCRNVGNFPTGCPDWTNLMFPLAGPDHLDVSAEQASVIRSNPLTKE